MKNMKNRLKSEEHFRYFNFPDSPKIQIHGEMYIKQAQVRLNLQKENVKPTGLYLEKKDENHW